MTREFKSRSEMSVGELIEADQARRAWALDRTETLKEDRRIRALAVQGIRPHMDGGPWDLAVWRPCEPGCWQHGGAA